MSVEEKIRPEEFDKELERLMSENGEKKGKKKRGGKKKKIFFAVGVIAVIGIAGLKVMGSRETKIPMVATVTPQ